MPKVTPYNQEESKKLQVERMFDTIAHKYDFLNHFLSFGIDKYWRRSLIRKVKKHGHKTVLDVATGTSDLAIATSRLRPEKVVGVDISEKMLEIGKGKIKKKGLEGIIELKKADAENLPFSDNTFDVVMVAFGIRNFENLEKGLKEINRVLKNGGFYIALEFSKPTIFPVKQMYNFYSSKILPRAGKKVSGDDSAYTYLPESVRHFPEGANMTEIMEKCHFIKSAHNPLTFKIVTLYTGYKE